MQSENDSTSDPECVFWDFSMNGNICHYCVYKWLIIICLCIGNQGGWSQDGCQLIPEMNGTDDYYTCNCSHLTHFAVIAVSVKMQLTSVVHSIL